MLIQTASRDNIKGKGPRIKCAAGKRFSVLLSEQDFLRLATTVPDRLLVYLNTLQDVRVLC
jgi:hypothetical protein